ncbi:hypothetical protein QTP88_003692 [Uroleucon formosanum]
MDIDIRIPRVTKIQCHRANAQPQKTDLSEFYHINYFLPYLDYLMSELNSRFHENNDSVISNLKLIIPKYYFACETSDNKILNVAQTYEIDLPHSIEALRGHLSSSHCCTLGVDSDSSDEEVITAYYYYRRNKKNRRFWVHPYLEKNFHHRLFIATRELNLSDTKSLQISNN